MREEFVWDDRMWDLVWERTLDQVDRHAIAMVVLRRTTPDGALQWRVAAELAKRWARHCVTLAVVYAMWTLFWASIAWHDVRLAHRVNTVAVGCTIAGVLAVGACLAFRRRTARFRGELLRAGVSGHCATGGR